MAARQVQILQLHMISPTDYKYVPLDPDPDFSPEHNARVLKETIETNERIRARKIRTASQSSRARTSAVVTYLKDLTSGNTDSSVTQYFGEHELARLRGIEIQETIKNKMSDALREKALQSAKQAR